MYHKGFNEEKRRLDEYEEDDRPFVKEIVLPTTLYKFAIKRGNETYKEVGFYLIGLFKNSTCIIHDLIEFQYSEQSGGFIESNMTRYIRLKAGLPLGLKIVGHMHKHPGFTEYSSTDKRNFLQYGNANPLNAFLIYIVDPYKDIRGYTATTHKIFPVEVKIRDLTEDELLLEKDIKIEFTTKIMLPKSSDFADLSRTFSENISSDSLKFISRPTIQINGESSEKSNKITPDSNILIKPRIAVEIEDIGKNKSLRYRLFMEENDTISDLEEVLKQLTHLPKKKGYKIIFYEEGRKLPRDMKIRELTHPVMWSLEKSPLIPVLTNFYKFWNPLFKLIERKIAEKPIEPATSPVKNLEPSGGYLLFKNFSKFLSDINEIITKNPKKEPETEVEIPPSSLPSDQKSRKKQKDYDKYGLDYYI